MNIKKYEWFADLNLVYRAADDSPVRRFTSAFEAQRVAEAHNLELEEIAAEVAAESVGKRDSEFPFSATVECIAKMVPLSECSFRPGEIIEESDIEGSAVGLAAKIHGVSAESVAFAVSERRVKLLQEWLEERGRV